MAGLSRTRRQGRLTFLARTRRRIQQLGPYGSLALLLVPLLSVEPLKLVALIVAGKGHWLTGTGMLLALYAVSLLVVERLFRTVKPKLLTLNWFAKLWAMFTTARDRTYAWLRSTTAKCFSNK